jgi:hypothetical protein
VVKGGSTFRGLVAANKEIKGRGAITAVGKEEWLKMCADLEQCYPATLVEKSWPKRFRRFQRSSMSNRQRRLGRGVVSCLEIDPELFHEFSPPAGLVQVGLQELIHLTTEKQRPPKLAERHIQIPGKSME